MRDYCLTCSSPADLSNNYMEKRDIKYISFHYTLDGVEYLDDMGRTISSDELFEKMQNGADTKTSQVAVGEYEAFFEKILKDGKDIIHLTLSSGISGTYNSACIARDNLLEKYPDRKLYVVDSLAASSGYGLLVDGVADKRDEGLNIDELYKWTEENKLNLHHWFYSTDLTFYIKGGRVSKTAGTIGNVLNICPLLNVDYEGKLTPREKIRGKKKVMLRTLEMMKEHVRDGLDYDGRCFISQSAFFDEAQKLADMIQETFPKLDGNVRIYPIGTTIGSHTGPGTIALFFWGDKRVD
ncbi:MAG: DegV family protein [Lachnospiraceae bacterium]|nr:DegV family protein [Lachnospiraceae bacterium]